MSRACISLSILIKSSITYIDGDIFPIGSPRPRYFRKPRSSAPTSYLIVVYLCFTLLEVSSPSDLRDRGISGNRGVLHSLTYFLVLPLSRLCSLLVFLVVPSTSSLRDRSFYGNRGVSHISLTFLVFFSLFSNSILLEAPSPSGLRDRGISGNRGVPHLPLTF